MADETNSTAGAGEQKAEQPRLMMHSQFLQDMSFENPKGASAFTKGEQHPQVKLNMHVDSRKLGETTYEVALKITGDASKDDERAFLVEIDYRGVFSITNADDNVAQPMLMIEGPRMLFPFARRIIADAVRDGGFPPLMLEPVDFLSVYRQRVAQVQAGAGEAEKTN
jgi:preprotein translocase subunit SecB